MGVCIQANVLGPLARHSWVVAYKQMCLAPWRGNHGYLHTNKCAWPTRAALMGIAAYKQMCFAHWGVTYG